MPNPTRKGERVFITIRVPVALAARLKAEEPQPDRNAWIVDAIEQKLGQ